MKLIDRCIDYVANRVLDRMQERRRAPVVVNNNVTTLGAGAGDAAKAYIARANRAMR